MRKFILSVFVFTVLLTVFYSCQTAEQVQQDAYFVNGRDLYIKHCQNCHGTVGEGLGALAPPLTDTVYLKVNKHQLTCFIKNGLTSPVKVHGRIYEGKMPDLNLADIDVAQLIVYVTNSFGNKQGMYTYEEVASDLKQCK